VGLPFHIVEPRSRSLRVIARSLSIFLRSLSLLTSRLIVHPSSTFAVHYTMYVTGDVSGTHSLNVSYSWMSVTGCDVRRDKFFGVRLGILPAPTRAWTGFFLIYSAHLKTTVQLVSQFISPPFFLKYEALISSLDVGSIPLNLLFR